MGNELGDYSALQSLCAEADKYGINRLEVVQPYHLFTEIGTAIHEYPYSFGFYQS